MLRHKAFRSYKDGNREIFEIDVPLIREMSKCYDDGCRVNQCVIAKAIMTAYETGVEYGIRTSENRQLQTAMLMMHTGGTA